MDKFAYSAEEQAFFESSSVPFAILQYIDDRIVPVALSNGFCRLFCFDDINKAYSVMDRNIYDRIHHDDLPRLVAAFKNMMLEKIPLNVLFRFKDFEDSFYRIIRANGELTCTESGENLAQVWFTDEGVFGKGEISDISELSDHVKNSVVAESSFIASGYDHLTGLPGMTYFFDLAIVKRSKIEAEGGVPVMMFMDFSGMKYFNHKFGFACGDRLLQLFARILADIFGNDNCSRLGQDHFAVVTEENDLENRLLQLFEECSKLDDGRSLPLHVGIYTHWFSGIAASMACDRAKIACDKLKNVYASQFSYYNESMKDAEDKQRYIIANLDKAISEGWITAWYQPIVRAVNGKVCEEEALARWIDPVMGFMSPADFIPVLEDHKLIYKLDLYIVECALKKLKLFAKSNLHCMPQSVNLSRSDFDTCDIVEEVRRRVDEAGLPHELLTIEITESTVGSDFDFMKKQIDRFRAQGFPVWMDDFGSGYSSLDVLQSLNFDLIKFDMRFMQQFADKNTKGKIILNEMLRMVTSLGIDTICEGVETEDQVQFLLEAGCSKLQGYYYQKPIPVEKILEKYEKGIQIGFENPAESGYYEALGRVNLHDLSFVAQENMSSFESFFHVIPMAVVELSNGSAHYARSNKAYREFMEKYFKYSVDQINNPTENMRGDLEKNKDNSFIRALISSRHTGNNIFIDERFDDGTTIHACMRRVAFNEETKCSATVLAVLSITPSEEGTTYANIARALVADFFNLYYVDITDDTFFEYSSTVGGEDMAMERHGEDFFHASRKDALNLIYKDDRDAFIEMFRKEKILAKLDEQGTFTHTYRLLSEGEPIYVSMKVMRMQHDRNHIIIGVRNVDAIIQQRIMLEKIRRNESILSRIMALSGNYICMYTVEPETEDYVEFSASDSYKGLGFANNGTQFFKKATQNARMVILPEDQDLFFKHFTREEVLGIIARDGIFTLEYRMLMSGEAVPVTLKAALVHEYDGDKLIIGVSIRE